MSRLGAQGTRRHKWVQKARVATPCLNCLAKITSVVKVPCKSIKIYQDINDNVQFQSKIWVATPCRHCLTKMRPIVNGARKTVKN